MDPSRPVLSLILQASLMNMPTPGVWMAILVMAMLIGLSAFMAASEIAFFSITQGEKITLRESDDAADQRLFRLLEKPRYLLSTILIGNNIVNIGVIIISYFIITGIFNFQDVPVGGLVIPKSAFDFLINVIIVTFFLVLFGEAIPKVYATHNKMRIALSVAGFFAVLNRLFSPINFILVGSTSLIEKKIKKYNAEIDVDEINKAIDITVQNKESRNDANMLKGIVHFGNLTVKQVMRPRMDVAAADIDWNFEELVKYVRETGYSRLPVYRGDMDHIEGVLYVKDLLEHLEKNKDFHWQQLIRESLHTPETKRIDDMLRDFQESRKHLAVVVDEFGGTQGIITLEDIVEEVVGDIKDEFDEHTDANIRALPDGSWLVEGACPVDDFFRALEISEENFETLRGDAETVAGLLLEIKGRFPKAGETVKQQNLTFKILSLRNNRIDKIKVERHAV
ncbi:MAG: gliding motility-associated protein GldE [Chitinophagales bacterium]